MFIGRKEERKILHELFATPKQENIVIYGRRRIGKSELVKKILAETKLKSIYYQAKQTSMSDNLHSLSLIIATHLNIQGLKFDTLENLLVYLFNSAKDEPFIFVIDEYPYLRALEPGIDSVIQKIIDEQKKTSLLKLIITGSYIDVMEQINYIDQPLFGRISLMLPISELNYQEASLFYKNAANEEKVKYYSVFGGVPYYNSLLNPAKTFSENVIDLIIKDNGPLSDFVEVSLHRELQKINNANAVLEAIATNNTKFSDILGKLQSSKISSSNLSAILDSLQKMGLITKEIPFNEAPKSRNTKYKIKDNYITFYYRYIFSHLSARRIMDPKVYFTQLIEEDFNSQYVPVVFEQIATQYLIIENKKGNINPPFFEIGSFHYHDKVNKLNGQFDVVTKDKKGYIFYEVKYTKTPVTEKEVHEEISQLNRLNLPYYDLGFISKSGFSFANEKTYFLRTLSDLYLID